MFMVRKIGRYRVELAESTRNRQVTSRFLAELLAHKVLARNHERRKEVPASFIVDID
jgi:hypothetical protein